MALAIFGRPLAEPARRRAPAADNELLGLLGAIGLSVDHGFDASGLSDDEKQALVGAATDG